MVRMILIMKLEHLNLNPIEGTFELLQKATDPGNPYFLKIEGVAKHHTGLYSCVAGNPLGETIETAFLQVNKGESISRYSYLILFGSLVSRIVLH